MTHYIDKQFLSFRTLLSDISVRSVIPSVREESARGVPSKARDLLEISPYQSKQGFPGNCLRRLTAFSLLGVVFPAETARRYIYNIFLIPAVFLLLGMSTVNVMADELGRLFTTPQERAALEKLRHQEPVKEIKTEITFEEPEVEEVKPDIGGITVDGLVYRKNGKSTAWINNSNTYEGDFSNQYLRINTGNIEPGNVQVEIPGSVNNIKLKVGQTYDPNAEKVTDLTE